MKKIRVILHVSAGLREESKNLEKGTIWANAELTAGEPADEPKPAVEAEEVKIRGRRSAVRVCE